MIKRLHDEAQKAFQNHKFFRQKTLSDWLNDIESPAAETPISDEVVIQYLSQKKIEVLALIEQYSEDSTKQNDLIICKRQLLMINEFLD